MFSVTRLQLRFAAATAVPIALAGVAIFWFVRAQQVERAETDVAGHARFIEEGVLRAELSPGDFEGVVRGAELRRLDRLFKERVLIDGGLRVKAKLDKRRLPAGSSPARKCTTSRCTRMRFTGTGTMN